MSEPSLSEIWNDADTLFVLDTNVLLNLYSYQDATKKAIYKSLDKVNDRLWAPHQVMLEFHKNRPEIIYKSKKNFDLINGYLDAFIQAHKCNEKELITFDTNFGKMYPELRELFNNFKESSKKIINEVILKLEEDARPIKAKTEELKKQTISLTGSDSIYQKLLELYSDEKVGSPFDQEILNKIYEDGEIRYTKEIPPGYKDAHKTEEFLNRGLLYKSKFGDLILYKQILKQSSERKIKNVIFISEDSKKDWKESVPHESSKYYGVRREIREEAFKEAGILNFLVFNTEEFIKHSKVKLDTNLVADLNAVHENYITINNFKSASEEKFKLSNISNLNDYILNLEMDMNTFSKQIQQLNFDIKHAVHQLNSIQQEIKNIEERIFENFDDLDPSELRKEHELLRKLNQAEKMISENLESLESKKRQLSKQRFLIRKNIEQLLTEQHNKLNSDEKRNSLEDSDVRRVRNSLEEGDVRRVRNSLEDSDVRRVRNSLEEGDVRRVRNSLEDSDARRVRNSLEDSDVRRVRNSLEEGDVRRVRNSLEEGDVRRVRNSLGEGDARRVRNSLEDSDVRRVRNSLEDSDVRRVINSSELRRKDNNRDENKE
ncbi:PIN-like domain-containing protein [Acinetobacter sp. YQ_14]|uniref:PIN-like domain-containing protein n=1 Tax=Acinetobacter sp. YQ_14 TaxID=3367236 RepID=UPI00370DC8CB